MQLNVDQTNVLYSIIRNAEGMIKSKLGLDAVLEVKLKASIDVKAEMLLPVIAEAVNLSPLYYRDRTRKQEAVYLRFIAAKLLRHHFPLMALREIGELLGGKDHTSVIHMIDTSNDLLATNNITFSEMYNRAYQAVEGFFRQ